MPLVEEFQKFKQESPAEQEIVIQIPNIVMNFDYAGIKPAVRFDVNSNEKVIVTLKNNILSLSLF